MILTVFSPESGMKQTFGESLEGPLGEMISRNWAKGVFLFGVMLIWGAFAMPVRRMALTIVGLSKLGFVVMVVGLGDPFLKAAMVPVVLDSSLAAYFAVYLFATRRQKMA
jgi:hypothetical protein